MEAAEVETTAEEKATGDATADTTADTTAERERIPHRPEYSDVGFLSEAEMAERRQRRIEVEKEKSIRLSQSRIGERERLKAQQELAAKKLRQKELRHKRKVLEGNRRKTAKSPFQVDLVAETERIDEEVMVRLQFEEKLQVVDTKRKEKVMDAVIRSALTEEDHVARLREEKRKLLIEQKRLLALRDMQKSDANLQRKKDMLAERTRQRQLQAQLAAEKRAQVVARQEAERQRKFEALKYRHGVQPSRDISV